MFTTMRARSAGEAITEAVFPAINFLSENQYNILKAASYASFALAALAAGSLAAHQIVSMLDPNVVHSLGLEIGKVLNLNQPVAAASCKYGEGVGTWPDVNPANHCRTNFTQMPHDMGMNGNYDLGRPSIFVTDVLVQRGTGTTCLQYANAASLAYRAPLLPDPNNMTTACAVGFDAVDFKAIDSVAGVNPAANTEHFRTVVSQIIK